MRRFLPGFLPELIHNSTEKKNQEKKTCDILWETRKKSGCNPGRVSEGIWEGRSRNTKREDLVELSQRILMKISEKNTKRYVGISNGRICGIDPGKNSVRNRE